MQGFYHHDKQVFTRSKGHSATGGAAYRAADRIYDERTGETFDYRRKKDVYAAEILTPENVPQWAHDRQALWNRVEQAEKRKDSQVAYSLTLAVPNDISHYEKTKLVKGYVQENFVDKGMVADIAYHDFEGRFSHNPHAHVMLTTRKIEGDRFSKKVDEWRPKIAKVNGRIVIDPEQLKAERGEWARHINNTYTRLGIDKQVSHLSYKERGIDRLPQIHMGAAHSIEHPKNKRQREPRTTRLGDINRQIAKLNHERDLQHQLAQAIEEKKRYEEQLKKQKSAVANNDHSVIEPYAKTKTRKPKATSPKRSSDQQPKAADTKQQNLSDLHKPKGRDR